MGAISTLFLLAMVISAKQKDKRVHLVPVHACPLKSRFIESMHHFCGENRITPVAEGKM